MLDSVHNLYLPAFSTEFDNNYNGEWVIVYRLFSSFLFLPNLAVLSNPPPLFAIVNVRKRNNSKSTTQTKFTNKIIHRKGFHCYIMNQLFKKKRLKILRYDNEKQTKHPICHIMSFYDCMWHYGRKKRWKKNENGNDHATMLSKQELRAK